MFQQDPTEESNPKQSSNHKKKFARQFMDENKNLTTNDLIRISMGYMWMAGKSQYAFHHMSNYKGR